MPKYKTLDQHVKWKGQLLPPGTEVTATGDDAKIWEGLVAMKVAEKLAGKKKQEEPPEEGEGKPPEKG